MREIWRWSSFNSRHFSCVTYLYCLKVSHLGKADDRWNGLSLVSGSSLQAEKATNTPEVTLLDKLHRTATVLIESGCPILRCVVASHPEGVPTWAAHSGKDSFHGYKSSQSRHDHENLRQRAKFKVVPEANSWRLRVLSRTKSTEYRVSCCQAWDTSQRTMHSRLRSIWERSL